MLKRTQIILSLFGSKSIFRNTMLLIAMSFLLYFPAKVLAVLSSEAHCDEIAIGPNSATCLNLAWCTWGDRQRFVYLWISNNTMCPNGTPVVMNRARVDGLIGQPGLVGTTRSTTVPVPRLIAFGVGFAYCNGTSGFASQTFFPDCNNLPPQPPPDICFFNTCYPGSVGNTGHGCSYCAYNWTTNAACSGPWDNSYCGPPMHHNGLQN